MNQENKNPKVTVVTGYYNRKHNLEKSINSILCQSYDNIEFIIFDDFSSDGTYELLTKISDVRIKLIKHEYNKGFTRGLIEAIASSTGDYVAIHGAGDVSYKDRLKKQVQILSKNEDYGMVGCYSERINISNNHKKTYKPVVDNNGIVSFIHGELMFNRRIYDKAGGYDIIYKYNQCAPLVRKIGKISKIDVIKEVLYCQYKYEGGVSTNMKKMFAQSVYSKIGRQLKSISGNDVKEIEYLPSVNNREAIMSSYYASIIKNGRVEMDRVFKKILMQEYKMLYILYNSNINSCRMKYLHMMFFPKKIIETIIKKYLSE